MSLGNVRRCRDPDGFGLLAAAVASYLLAQGIVAPVRRMAKASHRIAAGHYTERVPEGGADELAENQSRSARASGLARARPRRG